jgi:hypothetical protein
MKNLKVDPEYLKNLAKKQDQAAEKAASAAKATAKVGSQLWWSHGVVSGPSNAAAIDAEVVRRGAAEDLQRAFVNQAAKLRAADEVYREVDNELADNLKNQLLPR